MIVRIRNILTWVLLLLTVLALGVSEYRRTRVLKLWAEEVRALRTARDRVADMTADDKIKRAAEDAARDVEREANSTTLERYLNDHLGNADSSDTPR